uniref:hypothetical protein n=1 Tax=Alkalibacillus haloalkaliphilus TaxID=94136 RepID=UPI000497B054
MDYDKGAILTKTNIRFKQTDKIDHRIGGHPILLPIEFGFTDDYLYYFTLSSQTQHYVKDKD